MDLTVLRPVRVSCWRTANSVELPRAGWAGQGRAGREPVGWRPEGPDRHKLGLSQPLVCRGRRGTTAGRLGRDGAREPDSDSEATDRSHARRREPHARTSPGAGPTGPDWGLDWATGLGSGQGLTKTM